MKKFVGSVLTLIFGSTLAAAQMTTVTGTVVDTDGTTWANGSISVQFIPNPSYPNISTYKINGAPLSSAVTNQGPLSLSSGGAFSVSVYNNSLVTPIGSQWRFTVCPLSTAQCGVYTIPASGTSMNISSALTATIPPPRFPAVLGNYGYADVEAQLQLVPGSIYYNVNNACYKGYDSILGWSCITGQPISIPVPINEGGTGATTAAGALANLGGVPTTTTVNGHALSGNVTVSASDITTGTLPHAQLPTLVSGDIPNNAANTSGNAATATYATIAGGASPTGSASGDLSGSYPGPAVAKVNGVTYGASPSINTVPVVTGTNAITYEAVPNAALANSSTTVNGQTCTLGSTCTAGTSAHPLVVQDMSATAYTTSQLIVSIPSPVAGTIPSGGTGTYNGVTCTSQYALTAATTASTTFTLKYNGTSFGTVVFASSSSSSPTITISSSRSVALGGIISITAPATADTTAAGLTGSLCFVY